MSDEKRKPGDLGKGPSSSRKPAVDEKEKAEQRNDKNKSDKQSVSTSGQSDKSDKQSASTSSGQRDKSALTSGQSDKSDKQSAPSTSAQRDITSDDFDPLAALYADDYDKCESLVFQSLSQCESFFSRKEKRERKEDEEAAPAPAAEEAPLRPGEGRMAPMEALPERRIASILKDPSTSGVAAPSSRRPKRPTRNVLTRMDEAEEGPLSVLRRAVKNGIRIRVWTRAHVYIRGICSGFLVAYDKHMNLAMTDVDEEFLVPKSTRDAEHERARKRRRRRRLKEEEEKKENAALGEAEDEEDDEEEELKAAIGEWRVNDDRPELTTSADGNQTRFKFGQLHKRHIGQLFIKGDNVVMVSLVVS